MSAPPGRWQMVASCDFFLHILFMFIFLEGFLFCCLLGFGIWRLDSQRASRVAFRTDS